MSCIEHIGFYDNIILFPEHKHTSCEIMYLHKGNINLICEGKKYELKDDMLYIIPSGLNHTISIIDSTCYKRTLAFLNPWAYSKKYYSDYIYNILIGNAINEPIIIKDDLECRGYIDIIKKEIVSTDFLSEDIIISVVTQFLAKLFRLAGLTNNHNIRKPNKLVDDIQRYIQENCGSQIFISDIADKYFVSKFYLSHIFKERTGMSPRQFLTFTRLSKAYNLLHEPEFSVSEVAGKCGFTSTSYMIKKFGEQYNISPNKFRKQLFSKSKKYVK